MCETIRSPGDSGDQGHAEIRIRRGDDGSGTAALEDNNRPLKRLADVRPRSGGDRRVGYYAGLNNFWMHTGRIVGRLKKNGRTSDFFGEENA